MLIIPDQRRDEAERETAQQKINSRPLEFATMPWNQREDENDGDKLKRVRVFAEKAKADQQPGGEPEPERVRTSFEREPEGEHGGDPEEDRKRIDRHDEIADVEERDGVERDDHPKSGALVEQSPGKIIEEQARCAAKNRAPETDAKFGRAKKRGAGANGKCDPGPLAKVGGRKALGPHPVMRLIERQVAGPQHREPERRQTQDEYPNR